MKFFFDIFYQHNFEIRLRLVHIKTVYRILRTVFSILHTFTQFNFKNPILGSVAAGPKGSSIGTICISSRCDCIDLRKFCNSACLVSMGKMSSFRNFVSNSFPVANPMTSFSLANKTASVNKRRWAAWIRSNVPPRQLAYYRI